MSFKTLAQSQPTVAALFRRSLATKRLAHAYLFAGDAWPDLELAARELAKAANCESPAPQGGCDHCDACRRIDAATPRGGRHPDVQWVYPESKSRRIDVDQMRELERLLHQKASIGRTKVGVVVEADRLGREAANAFLKTLEEPPDRSLILLLTASPEQLLETVQSRCQRIQFGSGQAAANPAHAKVLDGLMALLGSGGSALAAYRLLSITREFLDAERARLTPEVEARLHMDHYRETADADWKKKMEEELDAQVEADYRRARSALLVSAEWLLRDLLLCASGGDESLLFFADRAKALKALAATLSLQRAMDNVAAIETAQDQLGRNVNESLALEVAFLRMSGLSAPAPVVT